MSAPTPTHDAWVILNGAALRAPEAVVSPLGAGLQLGHGVYTTLKVAAGRPVFFTEHHARLSADAREVGLQPPDRDGLRARVGLCLSRNAVAVAALKILLFQDAGRTSELIALRGPSPLEAVRVRGCRLKTVTGPAGSPATLCHKTTSYLSHLLARQEAQAAGCDDALWLDGGGRILETAGANIFAVDRSGAVLTPPVSRGLLPGVVRAAILREFPGAREALVDLTALADVAEVFITNSLIGVLPVVAVDGREFDVASYRVTPAVAECLRRSEARA
ncbi:MAG TPA: aminotransferase class IV [Opitutaceae bacterium]|nr:aminotransferase class IV [Opitutaceae bacterium]HPG17100.1 aminotransferase class IV [Opitutaceae bacterium]HPN99215.1 aminotransferase class IV [Opitutaceae bacterium]